VIRAALLQSNYLPWRGYFDLIRDVDVCVFYDCVQYTRQDWRNRNLFRVAGRIDWLSVPVLSGGLGSSIHQVRIRESEPWRRRHLKTLRWSYGKYPCFEEAEALVFPRLSEAARDTEEGALSRLNQGLIRDLCGYLGIKTRLEDSAGLGLRGGGTDRVLDALKKIGAGEYLTGPRARSYLEESKFAEAGIRLRYKDYGKYPAPPQPPAEAGPELSIFDLLCQAGPEAGRYIWGDGEPVGEALPAPFAA